MGNVLSCANVNIAKPFNPQELLVQIDMLLDSRRRIIAYFSQSLHAGKPLPPDDASVSGTIQFENAFIKKVIAIIEGLYADENFALPQLCREIGMSRSQLFRKMKAVADTSPSDLIRSFRLQKAKALLETGELNVAEATYQTGFKDPSYFSKLFQEEFGIQPSGIRK